MSEVGRTAGNFMTYLDQKILKSGDKNRKKEEKRKKKSKMTRSKQVWDPKGPRENLWFSSSLIEFWKFRLSQILRFALIS